MRAIIYIWVPTLIFVLLFIVMFQLELISWFWLVFPCIIFCLITYDYFQIKHSIWKNYPLIGRLRMFFETIRPEFRQYFFEGELDGKPFNKRQRSIVYQRAKNEKQTVAFGMQDDPNRIGFEWLNHSIYPKKADVNSFRINIGNHQCKQPYNASVFNISAMSYGALSKTAVSALNKGALMGNFAQNTGEGGISDYHFLGGDLIWQIGTGYFGCRDKNGRFNELLYVEKSRIHQVKMIELKLSQGAKPGHGGLLPASKNTPEIAKIRNVEPYTSVHSPSAHSEFSNAKELVLFLKKLRNLSKGKPIGFKLCIGKKEEFIEIIEQIVATNIIPDFITIDGTEGGTGAAPLEFSDNVGMPLTEALVFVHKSLLDYGIRDHIKIIASGKIVTSFDIVKTIALGADAVNSARGMMFALGCIQALDCDSGRCPVGITTQNSMLYRGLDITDKSVRVMNYHEKTLESLAELIGAAGFEKLQEITPRNIFKRLNNNQCLSYQDIYYN
jgi:glutamate synthase domain-containing protein 2